MVAEPPPQLLPHPQLLLTGGRVLPVAVFILSPAPVSAASPVQDGPLGVVRHRVVNSADVGKEMKVLQDMSGQFGL